MYGKINFSGIWDHEHARKVDSDTMMCCEICIQNLYYAYVSFLMSVSQLPSEGVYVYAFGRFGRN